MSRIHVIAAGCQSSLARDVSSIYMALIVKCEAIQNLVGYGATLYLASSTSLLLTATTTYFYYFYLVYFHTTVCTGSCLLLAAADE